MSPRRLILLLAFFGLLAGSAVAQPVITNISPVFGSPTDLNYISIKGNGLSPGTVTVKFNGVQSTNAAAVAMNEIQARIKPGTPLGTGKVFVQVGANSTLSLQDFTVIGAGPYVSSFSPTVGGAGVSVTISGAHFTGVTNVQFNGKSATFFIATDNSIQATAPSGVTSGPIVIRGPAGVYDTSTNTVSSNYYVPPVITGFTPAAGRPGTNVVITGTNLLGTTSVQFGAVNAGVVTVLSNGAVRVSVPAGAQTSQVLLSAPAGSVQTSSNFVVQPTVSGFSPGFGSTGTNVTVTGANLLGVTSVQFNGTAASFSGVTAGQLTATVPNGATTGPITVNTTNGSSASAATFYVSASIINFTPSNGPPGTLVKVTGANFTGATAVTFNGLSGANFFVTNNTTLGAVVPAGVTTGPLAVTTPAGTATSAGFFYGVPGITSFNPTHGLPGTNVVLNGVNFLGATFVRFNGLNASFVPPTSNTTLVATVPASATTGPITVGAPGGTNTSAASFLLDYTSELALSGTNAPDPVIIGTNLVYTLSILNNGPFAAPNVVFSNLLSPSVVIKSWTSSQGTLTTNGNVLSGNLGSLTSGSPINITITVTPQATGTITNIATVTSDYTDPSTGNNTLVTTATVLPLPVLTIVPFGATQVKISWPVALTNFVLQSKTNLLPATSWANVANTPVISGSQRTVTDSNSPSPKFYRLKN